MKENHIMNTMMIVVIIFCTWALFCCSSYYTIVRMPEVKEVPDGQYERIIKLYNPEGFLEKTIAGLVFVKKGARICTTYPREEIIRSLDELTEMERNSYRFFSHYEIKEDEVSYGFVSVPAEYHVLLWKDEKTRIANTKCRWNGSTKIAVPSGMKDLAENSAAVAVGDTAVNW